MITPEATAAAALRDWLLQELPASIATVNAARAAVLRSPQPGPFIIPALAVLKVSVTDKAGATLSGALTSGSRSTTQLAADINAILANLASVDSEDHLLITSPTAPSWTAATSLIVNSVVAVGADSTGANVALGFDISGEHVINTALVPPGLKGVADGLPLGWYFDPSQLGKGRVLVTIAERSGEEVDNNPRRMEWLVSLEVGIFRAEPQQVVQQTREGIQAALRAVRACLMTDAGKQLGRARAGDVVRARIGKVRVSGQSLTFTKVGTDGSRSPGPLFDSVNFPLVVRVYQAS